MTALDKYPLEIVLAIGSKGAEDLGVAALGAALGGPAGAIAAPAIKTLIEIGQKRILEWSSQGRIDRELEAVEKETALLDSAKTIANRVVSELGDQFSHIPVLQDLNESMWQELRLTAKVLHIAEEMQKDLFELLRLSDTQRYATTRMQKTRSLYEILSQDEDTSAREFHQIVTLLLFNDCRIRGKQFSPSVNDYGLDAVEIDAMKAAIGYEFRYFPSPLSSHERSTTEKWLNNAAEESPLSPLRPTTLKKLVLITPQNLCETTLEDNEDDATWFRGLQRNLGEKLQLEHWGHSHLQALFVENPAMCLRYYPELIENGEDRKRDILAQRGQYDTAIKDEYGRIEFVGMSVYKEEAARYIPIEQIYISLSVTANSAEKTDSAVSRQNPLELLEPGMNHVILGDPGSGKSTLLKFLALYGKSEPLQRRYRDNDTPFVFREDDRLPLIVTLRRYADELKKDDKLSLDTYIQAIVKADFSLDGDTADFFDYYLKSGKAILLFDGLDELPNPTFKKKIRDRIGHLIKNYPENTTIVTSRIVGYEDAVRFDEETFRHHRLAKLRSMEIEQFVHDWYNARLANKREQKEYRDSLLKILENERHIAIRELAQNPLLLTIMVLVHRIDAVLPDERHVLYQKCIPTISKRLLIVQSEWWDTIRDAYRNGTPTHSDIYAASALLIYSGMLYIIGLIQPDPKFLREKLSYPEDQIETLLQDSSATEAILDDIASLTRKRDDVPLKIAHCIRDLAYGDTSKADDLKRMLHSNNMEYKEIFERCYWRPIQEDS